MSDAVNAYRLLGVHPCAPNDLVNAAYWTIASELQKRRAADKSVDATLYTITRCYELVANPQARAAYDAAIGLSVTPVVVRPLSKIRRSLLARLLRRPITNSRFDLYEMIGLDSIAPDRILPDAYKIMRDQYLRVPDTRRRVHLLSLLDEAYAVLSDEDRRHRYDAQRLNHQDGNISNPSTRQEPTNPMPTTSPQTVDKARRARAPRPPAAEMNSETDSASKIGLAMAVSIMSRGAVAFWRAAKDTGAAAFRLASRLAIRLAMAAAIASRGVVACWRAAKGRGAGAFRPARHPSTSSKKDSGRTSVDLKPLQRPTTKKTADVEEAFLGRLATRVEQGELTDDSTLGD